MSDSVRDRVAAVAADHQIVDYGGWQCSCGQSAPTHWPRWADHLADLVMAAL